MDPRLLVTETTAQAVLTALRSGKIKQGLWIRGSRLGDFLFTLPTLAAFQERWPEVRLSLLTNAYTRELARLCPLVEKIIVFAGKEASLAGREGARIAKRLSEELGHCQLLLAPRPRPELPAIAETLGIPFLFPGRTRQERSRDRHVVLQTWERFEGLDLPPPGPITLLPPQEGHPILQELPRPPVLLHPGCDESARWKLRRGVARRLWPWEHWRSLALGLRERGQIPIFLSGSKHEGRWVGRFLARSRLNLPHLHGLPLELLAGTMAQSAGLVGVDSGPFHLATALGIPSVGLYGPSPASYTGPWSPSGSSTVLQKPLPCSPCQGKGVHCPKNVCMEEIRPEEVLEALLRKIPA
ncbi:MAG TPA: lipopolysaccharide heptosyltransferase family protein [Planctomycetes bacterium]|nr:lipopolysaccharide heptosyltransferase family protein [Planctomycetota bacterium]